MSQKERTGAEKLFEEIIAEFSPNLMKYMDTDFQESRQISSMIKSETYTEAHYNQTDKSQKHRGF